MDDEEDQEEDDYNPENPVTTEDWNDPLAPDDIDLDNNPDDEEDQDDDYSY